MQWPFIIYDVIFAEDLSTRTHITFLFLFGIAGDVWPSTRSVFSWPSVPRFADLFLLVRVQNRHANNDTDTGMNASQNGHFIIKYVLNHNNSIAILGATTFSGPAAQRVFADRTAIV